MTCTGHDTNCNCDASCREAIDLAQQVIKHIQQPTDTWRCRICGCTNLNCADCYARTGIHCHWVGKDLCSACVGD